jgi:hypothetical protein
MRLRRITPDEVMHDLRRFFPEKGGMGMNERGGEAKTERRQKKRSR